MIISYNTFINESIRDLMKPKSSEDIKKLLDKLSPLDKLDKIDRLKLKNIYTEEELKEIFKDFSVALKIEKGAQFGFVWAVEDGLKNSGKKYNKYIDTVLTRAASYRQINVIKYILDNNKIIDIKSINDGISRVRVNRNYAGKRIYKLLSDRRLEMLQDTDNSDDLLIDGCIENNYEMVKRALDKGANKNLNGGRPIEISIENNNTEITKLLLDKGAVINKTMDISNKIIEKDNVELLKLLLDKGIKVDNRDISLAISYHSINILKLLHSRGIEIPINKYNVSEILKWMRKDINAETISFLLKINPKLKELIQNKINELDTELKKYQKHLI
jgi:ankyrin repeat protein